MAQDGKLDLLLKTMAENEKKREEAEARTRADFAELKLSLDVRLPAVEKKVETLNTVCKTLSAKVEQLEGSIALQRKDDEFAGKVTTAVYPEAHKEEPQDSRNFQSTPLHHGMRDSTLISPIPFPHDDSAFQSSSHGQSSALVYSIPPMTFPQFNGDNPQMWKANCEIYFDVYGIHPRNWVKVATLNFCGNAAFWLQSVRSQLAGATWFELCERVCARFSRDRQQTLIRQWIRISQSSTISDYVERFDSIMHQLLAYRGANEPIYFVTKFVDGLKDNIRLAVMMLRPQDLDTACSLALLQEEALEGVVQSGVRRQDSGVYVKSRPTPTPVLPTRTTSEDKVGAKSVRTREDKLLALKSYRRSKGLCFKSGERWGKDHKCAASIQLHVVEELLNALQFNTEEEKFSGDIPETADDALMSISYQSLNGIDSSTSIRLRGWVQGTELLMLVDSGSTHSFVDERIGSTFIGLKHLPQPLKVQIADGGQLSCSQVIPKCDWWIQGHNFSSDFRLLPLGSYDAILGMDWLQQFSPMQIEWNHKWLEFSHLGKVVKLQGITPQTSQCATISGEQLQGMTKKGFVMCLVQLQAVELHN